MIVTTLITNMSFHILNCGIDVTFVKRDSSFQSKERNMNGSTQGKTCCHVLGLDVNHSFLALDALNQHLVTHTDEHFACPSDNCDKDFNTLLNLKQHLRGKHSDGFISYCGSSFDWSDNIGLAIRESVMIVRNDSMT